MRVVDVVQGFLGSGKTTLIDHLIREVFTKEKILVLQTEWGDFQLPDYGSRVKVCSWDWEKGFPPVEMQKLICTPGVQRVIIEVNGMSPGQKLLETLEILRAKGEISLGASLAVFHGPTWQTMGKPLEELFRSMALTSHGFWIREGTDDLHRWIMDIQPKGCVTSGGHWSVWYQRIVQSTRLKGLAGIAWAAGIIAGMYLLYWFLFARI